MISTYTELKTAIKNWLHRSDLDAKIPDFIALAESMLNRKLKLYSAEKEFVTQTTIGSEWVDLPTDFGNPIALYQEKYIPRQKLFYKIPQELEYLQIQSIPTQWSINNNKIQLDRYADQVYPLRLRYRSKLALSDSNPTNDLLTNYPDAYLYASLIQSAPYLRDDQRMMLWEQKTAQIISEINEYEARNMSLAKLSVDEALTQTQSDSSYNFYEG